MRRTRAADDRGHPITLYGSPVTFFRIGESTIPRDVQKRIARRARKHRGGTAVAMAGVLVQLAMFAGYFMGIRFALNQGKFSLRVAVITVSVTMMLASAALLWMMYAYLGRVRVPVFIASFLAERRCPACGYDLAGAAAADDGLTACPECGAVWRVRNEP